MAIRAEIARKVLMETAVNPAKQLWLEQRLIPIDAWSQKQPLTN